MLYYVINLCAFISFHSFVISNLCYREYKIIKAYVLIDKVFETIRISRAENFDFCVNYYFWKRINIV